MFFAFSARATDERRPPASATRGATAPAISAPPAAPRKRDRLKRSGTTHTVDDASDRAATKLNARGRLVHGALGEVGVHEEPGQALCSGLAHRVWRYHPRRREGEPPSRRFPSAIAAPWRQKVRPWRRRVTNPCVGRPIRRATTASVPALAPLSQVAPWNSRRSSSLMLHVTIRSVPARTIRARPAGLALRARRAAREPPVTRSISLAVS